MSFFKDILKCTKMHYCVVVALIALYVVWFEWFFVGMATS